MNSVKHTTAALVTVLGGVLISALLAVFVIRYLPEREAMVEKNYQIALQFLSYEVLAYNLMTIMINFEGLVQYSQP